MIAKCQPIGHGRIAILYAMNPDKHGVLLATNCVGSTSADEIANEFEAVNNSRDRIANKFLRFEIGIAPKDEEQMTTAKLRGIVREFAHRMGLNDFQWIAATHRNTDNLHVHLIANRVSLSGEVYKTNFVSNRAARVAEEISRAMGLTIANECRRTAAYARDQTNDPKRIEALERLRAVALAEYASAQSLKQLGAAWRKRGIESTIHRNRAGQTSGIRLRFEGFTFKASEVDRRLGYKTVTKHFKTLQAQAQAPMARPAIKVGSNGIEHSPALQALLDRMKRFNTYAQGDDRRKHKKDQDKLTEQEGQYGHIL